MEPNDFIWTEKYRPSKVSEVVGDFREKILNLLNKPDSIQHLLFHSKSPGTGKTSLAKAIIKELDCDALVLNSSEERKIETVREKVKQFAQTKSSRVGKRRIAFMDEFDGMSKDAQRSLKNIMETFNTNVLFILTTNNINKIIDEIQSRCLKIPFSLPDKNEIKKYLENICIKEDLKYSVEGIDALLEMHYPNIRDCVVILQDLHTVDKPVTPENIKKNTGVFEQMWFKLKEKKWREIKEYVLSTNVEPRDLNSFFWEKALNEEPVNLKLVQMCCLNEKDIAKGASSDVVFVTSIVELCK